MSAPKGLNAAGKRLWTEMSAAYELDPGESALLLQACRTADELERLEVALVDAPMTVAGSTGQARPNPLLEETRRHRAALVALLKVLRTEPERAVAPEMSKVMSNIAMARWEKERRRAS